MSSKKGHSSKGKEKSVKEKVHEKHTREYIKLDGVSHTHTPDSHSAYNHLGLDNSFNLDTFKKEFDIKIQTMTDDEIVFDMVGIDIPLANTFRRILIAEVPTMCIENVYIINNTSILPDEMLAHRIGLVPLAADPRKFKPLPKGETSDEAYDVFNTLIFTLNIACEAKPGAKESDPEHQRFINSRVYSKDLVWEPAADDQLERLGLTEPMRTVHPDILLAKLRPGQSIELKAYGHLGYGKDHAKFSPVATASYRLLPEIVFNQDITGADAKKLVEMCPMKVFDIEDIGGQPNAVVANPRNCTMCRECIRHPGWNEKISLRRVKTHFIFSVESTGVLSAKDIVVEALKQFLKKIQEIRTEYQKAIKST